MYMIHFGYGGQVNHNHVPLLYRLPLYSENMAGIRLLLLEELDLY